MKCYILGIAFYSAETWTLRKVHLKYLETFEVLYWRRKVIVLTDSEK
jgi:hypothetical protein